MSIKLSERWIKECYEALEKIRELSEKEDKDRLERLRSIKLSLYFLNRSLIGWNRWVNNPASMANFSEKELEEIELELSSTIASFIEYDIKTTKLGAKKGLKKRVRTMKYVV
jgi:hypothetical protein